MTDDHDLYDDEFDDDEDDEVYLTDRTSAETDDKCGMKYYWYKHENGTGIVPKKEALALTVGKHTHEDLAFVAEMEDISYNSISDTIGRLFYDALGQLPSDPNPSDLELLYRRFGWMAAFALYVEPRIRAEYETEQIESEYVLDRTPLWVAFTPDRLLRHRKGGYLVYREYKTTISASSKWLASWNYAIQLHIGLAGLQEEFHEPIAFAQVMGLMKGESRDGKLRHPYVWAYYNSTSDSWTHDYNKARTKDWEPMPVWEFPGGIVEWVRRCGEEVALAQFPHSQPVFYNPRLLTDWVTRRIAREEQIAGVVEECHTDWEKRVIYFEPRTAQCKPPFGDPCPYLLPCHNAAVREAPLACGEFVVRTPHHNVEITLKGGVE